MFCMHLSGIIVKVESQLQVIRTTNWGHAEKVCTFFKTIHRLYKELRQRNVTYYIVDCKVRQVHGIFGRDTGVL